MSLPEITLCIGIDARTIEQLRISWPTWKRNRPEMWDWNLLAFFDRDQLHAMDVYKFFAEWSWRGAHRIAHWPPPEAPQYESQRAKMLTGHVFVPAIHCQTHYHCKIDVDALARPGGEWPKAEWFQYAPAVIAPRWNYSKGKSWLGMLEDWGERALSHYEPLGCRSWPNYSDDAMRVGHARWCSWCSFYRTDFTKEVARLCELTLGPCRLPVPSQDTTMWYVAERMKQTVRIENMKRLGFTNHSRIDELRRVAAEIMGETANAT